MALGNALTNFKKRVNAAGRRELYTRSLQLPIRKNVVLYESFSGNGPVCNPEAIFNYLTSHPEYKHLKHVWVTKGQGFSDEIRKSLKSRGDVTFVENRSIGYWTAVATSKYLINRACQMVCVSPSRKDNHDHDKYESSGPRWRGCRGGGIEGLRWAG
jgi:CDP-glycerol glycerophosphotransferase (TagB/SpsB family)